MLRRAPCGVQSRDAGTDHEIARANALRHYRITAEDMAER
jgi:hypothetical protein